MNSVSLPLEHQLDLRPARASSWRRIAREPLLHFALIGASIFAGAHLVEDWKREQQTTIVIDARLRGRLAQLYRNQFGVAPTAQQLDIVVDDYVDDEVLYREALRLGLGDDDEIVRRRLIQKLEFLQRDSAVGVDPSSAELRTYYEAHPELFSAGARVSFSQRYFNPDRGGDAQALERARAARSQLLAGDRVDGDDFTAGYDFSELTRAQAERLFGSTAILDSLFTQAGFTQAGDWSEPVRSGLGWHVVKTIVLEPPRVLPFEEVLPDVRAAYLHEAASRARRARFDGLRAHYHIDSRKTAE
jgi:peptidyl-prolyl cis-trans isomerase C